MSGICPRSLGQRNRLRARSIGSALFRLGHGPRAAEAAPIAQRSLNDGDEGLGSHEGPAGYADQRDQRNGRPHCFHQVEHDL